MFTRKSLFVALTVLAMLAMLVPAAFAAPEQVTGVTITSPTEGNPVLLDPPTDFTISYTITSAGQQANPVDVTFYLINQYGTTVQTQTKTLAPGTLVAGMNNLTFIFHIDADLPEGLYNVRICIDDHIDPYCTLQPRSVRVDNLPPTVTLERPAGNEGCTWVTGNQYELFGMATDNVAVASAWFEFTRMTDAVTRLPIFNNQTAIKIGNENGQNVGQNATAVAGFDGEFTALWNSSLVPDGTGYIRFCAKDTAGHVACTTPAVTVCIENRVKVPLQKGWNLISTPLMLYNGAVSDVLTHVWNPTDNTVWTTAPIDKIYTYRNGANPAWTWWSMAGPDGVSTIQDGYGYWVHAVAPAEIEFVGTWLSIGPVTPPEYPVRAGWNLIGYTHFGTPTMGPWPEVNKTVTDYLGFPMRVSVESMYRYDARLGRYFAVDEMTGEQWMRQGAGYWLALAEGTEGTINP